MVTTKEKVISLVNGLPEDTDMNKIIDELTFIDLMEKGILKPHTMEVSAVQSDKAEYLKTIFTPDGIFMGTLASERNVNVYFPFKFLNYHFFIAGATGSGKSNLNQVFIDGLLQHNANVIMNGKGKRASSFLWWCKKR